MQKPNFLVLAALSLALAAPLVPAFARPALTATPLAHEKGGKLKKMAGELGLTDSQKAQLKPIIETARQQAKAIKDDTTLSEDARKAKLKDLRKSTREQTMAILTPDQKAKLKEIRQAKRQAKENAGA